MHRHRLVVAALAATALTLPAGARAATTIGTSPDAALETAQLFGCAPDPTCTLGQERLSNEALRVPTVGGSDRAVVVSWRIRGQGGQARLRRLGGGATAPLALPAAAGTQSAPAQLAVAAGDQLVVDLDGGAAIAGEPDVIGGDAYVVQRWTPALADGETRAPAATQQAWLFYEATLEPDRDGDGLGDETQDSCVACDQGGGDRGGGDPGGGDRGGGGERAPDDPYAAIRKRGPRVKIAAKATATRAGAASLTLTNPYDFTLTGRLVAKAGRRAAGSARVTLKPGASATVRLKLSAAARRTLTSKRSVKLTLTATLRAAAGRAGTTRRTVAVKLGGAPRRAPARAPTGRTPGGAGFDGTYRAPDGYTLVVQRGFVLSFSGTITTYCTETSRQKRVAFGMFGDDPDPKVAADGSFTWEATRGYGFVKLRFDGRIVGDVAKGRLMVEDRSPLLGTGRFEFDYCFAGDDWELKR